MAAWCTRVGTADRLCGSWMVRASFFALVAGLIDANIGEGGWGDPWVQGVEQKHIAL